MFQHSQDIAEYIAGLLPIEEFFTFGTLCKLTRDVTLRANVRACVLRNNFPQTYVLESIRLGMEDVFSSPHFSDKERLEQISNYSEHTSYDEPPRFYFRRAAREGYRSVLHFILENRLDAKNRDFFDLYCDAMKYAVLKDDRITINLLLTLSKNSSSLCKAAEEVKDLRDPYQNGYSELIENICFELDIELMEIDCVTADIIDDDYICPFPGPFGSFGPEDATKSLIFAAENNIEPILRYLVNKEKVYKYDAFKSSIKGFKRAAKNGHENIVRLFMTDVFPKAVFAETYDKISLAQDDVFQRVIKEEQSCILSVLCNTQPRHGNQSNTIFALEMIADDGKSSLFNEMCYIGAFKNPVSVLKYAIEHENEFLIQKLIEFKAFG